MSVTSLVHLFEISNHVKTALDLCWTFMSDIIQHFKKYGRLRFSVFPVFVLVSMTLRYWGNWLYYKLQGR